jgi:hypothetical protein
MAGSYSTTTADFVVMDSNDNVTPPGIYGVRALRYSGTGSAIMEWDGGVDELFTNGSAVGSTVPNWTGLLDTYDVLLTAVFRPGSSCSTPIRPPISMSTSIRPTA